MVTPKLWYALYHPPATHPIFQRTVVLPDYQRRRYLSWANTVIQAISGISLYSPFLLFLLLPLVLLVIGLTYGLDCALRVGAAIARERESRTYTLLAAAPSGAWGFTWALSTSAIYRNHDFPRLGGIVRVSLQAGLAIAIGFSGLILLFTSPAFSRFPQSAALTLASLVNFGMVIAALYAEYVQSVILGVLVGITVAVRVSTRLDASLLGFIVYLMLQLGVYALTLALGFALLTPIYDSLRLTGEFAPVGLSLLRLLVFCAIREALIALLWRALVAHLLVMPDDMV